MLSESTALRLLGHERVASAGRDGKASRLTTEKTSNVKLLADAWILVFWIEVPLRNLVHAGLVEQFGARWWQSLEFRNVVGKGMAKEAGNSSRGKKPGTTFLDDMPFGYWVRFLAPGLDQRVWVPFLHKQFVGGVSRKDLHSDLLKFKTFRNAIAHHESRSNSEIDEMRALAINIANAIHPELVQLVQAL